MGGDLNIAFYIVAGMILLPANVLLVADLSNGIAPHPLIVAVVATVAQLGALILLERRING